MLQLLKKLIKKHTTKSTLDTSTTHTNAEAQDNSNFSAKEKFTREKIDETPFEIITMNDKPKEKNSFIAIGNQRITDLTTKEELIHQIQHGNWDLMTKVMVHIAGRMVDGALDMLKSN